MELATYAELAIRLANTVNRTAHADRLRDLDDLRALTADLGIPDDVTDSDLRGLRQLRDRLRAVFDAATTGDEQHAVDLLNGLLAEHPIHPRISGHDQRNWHFHLGERGGFVERYTAQAVMGLATLVTLLGPDRLGVCQEQRCDAVFADTSANRSRRYCSGRCATRANVAAYRARRAKAPASAGAGQ